MKILFKCLFEKNPLLPHHNLQARFPLSTFFHQNQAMAVFRCRFNTKQGEIFVLGPASKATKDVPSIGLMEIMKVFFPKFLPGQITVIIRSHQPWRRRQFHPPFVKGISRNLRIGRMAIFQGVPAHHGNSGAGMMIGVDVSGVESHEKQ